MLFTEGCGGGSTPPTYTVSAIASGLPSDGSVVVYNNGGDALTLSANGMLTAFSTPLARGATYAVTVHTNPNTYKCTVGNGSGAVTSNVTSVTVSCTPVTYTVSTLAGTAGVSGTNDGTGAAASFNVPRQIAIDVA